jgi:signal transduction histidine kinase
MSATSERQFAADIIKLTHDLRSPLAAIRGFADVLIKKGDQLSEADRKEFLTRIATNATVLDGLIGDLRGSADRVAG